MHVGSWRQRETERGLVLACKQAQSKRASTSLQASSTHVRRLDGSEGMYKDRRARWCPRSSVFYDKPGHARSCLVMPGHVVCWALVCISMLCHDPHT